MDKSLLQPSIEDGYSKVKTYNITKLFYISFFGGVIPTVVLGNRNMKWLGIDKKNINLMTILGVGFFLLKYFAIFYIYSSLGQGEHFTRETTKSINLLLKVLPVMLALIYKGLMSKKYKAYLLMGVDEVPILKDSIPWIFTGIGVEAVLVTLGGIFLNVI